VTDKNAQVPFKMHNHANKSVYWMGRLHCVIIIKGIRRH